MSRQFARLRKSRPQLLPAFFVGSFFPLVILHFLIEPVVPIDLFDVISEGLFAGVVLVWAIILHEFREYPDLRMVQIGLLMLFVGGLSDFLGEFNLQWEALDPFENVGIAGGAVVATLGFYRWSQRLIALNKILDHRVQEKTREVIFQSRHDALTGMYNRWVVDEIVQEHINQAERGGKTIALLYVDLDKFKEINDRHGHARGDEVLTAVAGAMEGSFRKTDVLFRLGGDEFAILLTNLDDRSNIGGLIEKMADAVGSLSFKGVSHVIEMSVGVALYPIDGGSPDDLLRVADARMYQAKIKGLLWANDTKEAPRP